jgi:hypothetical protein
MLSSGCLRIRFEVSVEESAGFLICYSSTYANGILLGSADDRCPVSEVRDTGGTLRHELRKQGHEQIFDSSAAFRFDAPEGGCRCGAGTFKSAALVSPVAYSTLDRRASRPLYEGFWPSTILNLFGRTDRNSNGWRLRKWPFAFGRWRYIVCAPAGL